MIRGEHKLVKEPTDEELQQVAAGNVVIRPIVFWYAEKGIKLSMDARITHAVPTPAGWLFSGYYVGCGIMHAFHGRTRGTIRF